MELIDKKEIFVVKYDDWKYARINGQWHTFNGSSIMDWNRTTFEKHIELEEKFKSVLLPDQRDKLINTIIDE